MHSSATSYKQLEEEKGFHVSKSEQKQLQLLNQVL